MALDTDWLNPRETKQLIRNKVAITEYRSNRTSNMYLHYLVNYLALLKINSSQCIGFAVSFCHPVTTVHAVDRCKY